VLEVGIVGGGSDEVHECNLTTEGTELTEKKQFSSSLCG
jgi:hypothetical protein